MTAAPGADGGHTQMGRWTLAPMWREPSPHTQQRPPCPQVPLTPATPTGTPTVKHPLGPCGGPLPTA